MSASRKRKLSTLQGDDYQYDTPQPIKRFKSTPENNKNKQQKFNGMSWLKDGSCKIVQHRITNNLYEFCAEKWNEKKKNQQMAKLRTRQKWLYHNDVKHLECYALYLRLNELSKEDAMNKTWEVEEIWSHVRHQKRNEILFEVKWLHYPAIYNTFEPYQHLLGNIAYINYCRENNIERHQKFDDDDNEHDIDKCDDIVLIQCVKCNKYRITAPTETEHKEWQCAMNKDEKRNNCDFDEINMDYITNYFSHSQIFTLQNYVKKHVNNIPKANKINQCGQINANNINQCCQVINDKIDEIYTNLQILKKVNIEISSDEQQLLSKTLLKKNEIEKELQKYIQANMPNNNNNLLIQQIMEYDAHKNNNNANIKTFDMEQDLTESESDSDNDDDEEFVPKNYKQSERKTRGRNSKKKANKKKPQKRSKSKKSKINIVDTAPWNSRYFESKTNNNNNDNKESINMNIPPLIPLYDHNINENEITKEILTKFNISFDESKPKQNVCEAPSRELSFDVLSKYQIVLIIGESGSGKSTLLNKLYDSSSNKALITYCDGNKLRWDRHKSIISEIGDDCGGSTERAMEIMQSIGLNSVPNWLKPYFILSQGEQYRATFGRLLNLALTGGANQYIIMDEYSSVLDRQNATCMSSSICKFIRSKKKQNMAHFILASTNTDIIRYLQPDLLISLGGNNEMKLMENPNNMNDVNEYAADIKVVLDLPALTELKGNVFNLSQDMNLNTLQNIRQPIILNNNKVIRLRCNVNLDTHTSVADSCFDFDFNGDIMTDIVCLERHHIHICAADAFNIGVIYGASGCGKTSTAERLFGKVKQVKWTENVNIAQHFQCITGLEEKFDAVCLQKRLSLSYYHCLSDGEKHRVNIARNLGEDNVTIDEFTSFLDRETAKKVAIGVSQYIHRNNNKNIVFLACHSDIIEALNGNWLFDIENKKVFHFKPLQFPSNNKKNKNNNEWILDPTELRHEFMNDTNIWKQAKIRIYLKASQRNDFKPKFSKYHYLTDSILSNAKCFTAWASFSYRSHKEKEKEERDLDLKCVGFISFAVHPFAKSMKDNVYRFHFREHRTVILPSYQGLGIGSRIADCMAEYLALHGYRLQSKTAHPRYGQYRDKSPLWNPTGKNHQKSKRTSWNGADCSHLSNNLKKWFSHVYKLPFQRNETDEKYLQSRVIVKKRYCKKI